MSRAINEAGLRLVKKSEGFYPDAYLCPAGVPTIGYGHTDGVSLGQTITEAEAETFLKEDLEAAAKDVERLITAPLTDNQFSALVSFVFNLGAGSLQSSTLRKRLEAGNYEAVPGELNRWVKATDPVTGEKKTLRGLVKRRAAEGALWLTPDGAENSTEAVLVPQRAVSPDEAETSGVPTLEAVNNSMRQLGYKVFDGVDRASRKRNYDLNIFGVRTASSMPGVFDDWMGAFWMNWDTDGWEYHIWSATTDPGLYWLQNPMNVKGTAILVPDQYRSAYQLGLHRGKYEALVQSRELRVYRDENEDGTIDMRPETIESGLFGINIHRASADRRSIVVDKWSAGCQVVAGPADFAKLMDICKLAEAEWGPSFTYTLLTEAQLLANT